MSPLTINNKHRLLFIKNANLKTSTITLFGIDETAPQGLTQTETLTIRFNDIAKVEWGVWQEDLWLGIKLKTELKREMIGNWTKSWWKTSGESHLFAVQSLLEICGLI